jgi:hypothetical protein
VKNISLFVGMKYRNNACNSNKWCIFIFGLSIFSFLNVISPNIYAEPKIFLEQSFYDLGKVDKDGNKQKFEIPVFNHGDGNLEIKYKGVSCGCITLKSIDEEIFPGKSGRIVLELDPSRTGSGFKKQVLLLSTNDPQKKQVSIELQYKAKLEDVAISPEKVYVELTKSELANASGQSKNTIIVVDTWINRLKIINIETSSNLTTSFYDILYRCPLGSEIHLFRFETELSSALPVGNFDEWIKFTTNHPDYPSVTIPIKGVVISDVEIIPKTLVVRDIDKKQKISRSIIIKTSPKSKNLEIEDISVSDNWLEVRQTKIDKQTVELKVEIFPEKMENVSRDGTPKLIKSQIKLLICNPDKEERFVDILCSI